MVSKIFESLHQLLVISLKTLKDNEPKRVHSLNYWIYAFSGFWRYRSTAGWKNYLYMAYTYLIRIIYGVSFFFFLLDAIVSRNDLEKLSFNMSSSVLLVTKLVQMFLFSNLVDELEELYDKLEHHFYLENVGESEEDQKILREKAKLILRISLMFYILLLLGFPLRVLADTAFESRLYLIPVPFKELADEYYEFIYLQQAFISFHFMLTTLAYDLIGFSIIIRLIGHYEILEKNFLKIKSLYPKRNFEIYVRGYTENVQAGIRGDVLIRKTNYLDKMETFFKNYKMDRYSFIHWSSGEKLREEKTFQLLKDNIRHHQKLLAGIRTFVDAYGRPMLIQLFGMVLLVGIATLQILFRFKGINIMFMQQLLYVSTTIINIFCLCSFGSELTSRSISATNALYDTPWYEMNINNRNAVNLILEKLSQAPVLKGGGMINIDRSTCVKFLQTAYNMVALLRNKI